MEMTGPDRRADAKDAGSRETVVPGLYETVYDSEAKRRLEAIPDQIELGTIDKEDLAHVLSEHVGERLRSVLITQEPEARLKLVSTLLREIDETELELSPKNHAQKLLEIKANPDSKPGDRPNTPLTDSVLLTNASHEPAVQSELRSEFLSADSVDVIMAFVKWTGLRTLETSFAQLRARGVRIRLITSTYMGVTERAALDRLAKNYGVHIRIAYDGRSTRLHAKSWLIRRNTGFHTAFVGSSNLSRSALLDGLEWNVRLARNSTPAIFSKFEATFESYWASASFEEYDPDRDGERLDAAIESARTGNRGRADGGARRVEFSTLDVRPYPYQQRMLDDLELSRRQGHHENLLVAATGTGKTVVAALDSRRVRAHLEDELGRTPRTLFVAHRREILNQARRTFAEVSKQSNFGLIAADGVPVDQALLDSLSAHRSTLFATIQSLHADALDRIPPDFFDIVIIDEFHHAEAASYRRLLDHLESRELLGLTATPERGDGINVAQQFFGGRIASELRLWEALDEDLLVPFHYFMNADHTDLSGIALRGGEYDTSALSNLYTGNDARVRLIFNSLRDHVLDPGSMRALCFCVDISHAQYMAVKFSEAGLRAVAVTSRTSTEDRDTALQQLRDGELQVICAVDIFNEGVDLPMVDTLMMLRPTSSPTIFLQQLGRGLRRSPGKSVLTVLDYVGNQATDFPIHRKFRVLTGQGGRALEKSIADGFPSLPSGSQIVLDEYSQATVLSSIREKISVRFSDVVNDVRVSASLSGTAPADLRLTDYLADSMHELPDLYARSKAKHGGASSPWSWWRITRLAAGLEVSTEWDDIRSRLRNLARVNDRERAREYVEILRGTGPIDMSDLRRSRYAHMLAYSFFPDGKRVGTAFDSIDDAIGCLREVPGLASELEQIFEVRIANDEALVSEPKWGDCRLSDVPLLVGASYSREELLAAIDVGRGPFGMRPGSMREGVYYARDLNLDALLITLVKSEADFSPQTMYHDYALSPDQFHWESQATTSDTSATGQRYETGTSEVALFIRSRKTDEFDGGAAYTFAGPAERLSSAGSQPIQVVWGLEHELPPELYLEARAVAGA